MTPKQTIKLLETEFKNKVDIVTSPTFKDKSVEDKIAELAKMYKAGQNIQRMLNDGKGLTTDEIKQYRGRVLTGFKKLKAIINSISSELSAEEDAVSMVKAKASSPVSESVETSRSIIAGNEKTAKELVDNFGRMFDAASDDELYRSGPRITIKDVVEKIQNINMTGDRTYGLTQTYDYEDLVELSLLDWGIDISKPKDLEAKILSDLNGEYGRGEPKFMDSDTLHKCWRCFPTMADNCEQVLAYVKKEKIKSRSHPSSLYYRGPKVS
jgi:hypothetical protein